MSRMHHTTSRINKR